MEFKPSILYLTDFHYPARGRVYYEEDIYIMSFLKEEYQLLICHPQNSEKYETLTDLVMFRNTGSVVYYKQEFDRFVQRVQQNSIKTYNQMIGKGDTKGKQHLLDLTKLHYPVIPSAASLSELDLLPSTYKYLLKLKNGADSIGMKTVSYKELLKEDIRNYIIQPYIDFEYEVSFYFVDGQFLYALYTPDKTQRWELTEYIPTEEDLLFATQFIRWNSLSYGIQRVDACRLKNNRLLLVELEDLNPFLSLDRLSEEVKKKFISAFKHSIANVINT